MKTFFIKAIKNKYVIISLIFIIWFGFIDDKYNVMRHLGMRSQIKANMKEIERLEKEIEKSEFLLEKLKSDIEFVEKYGRENNYVIKEGEVVYYIEPNE